MTKLLTTGEFLLYITLTNYMTVLGGVLLWVSLFLLGLIARRLERAFEVATHWRFLLWSPSGILLYTVYTLVHAGPGPGGEAEGSLERTIAYGALAGSAVFCLFGCGATFALLARLSRARAAARRSGLGGGLGT